MRAILRNIANWVFYGNIMIAVCAMCFTLQAYYLLRIEPIFDILILMSGVSTLFTYLLIRIAAVSRIKNYQPEPRWDFFLRQMFWMRLLTILSATATIILYFLLPRSVQIILLIPGLISLLYGITIKFNGKQIKLRDLGFVKIFLIAMVWAFAGSYLPAINAGENVYSLSVLMLFLANFFYIFAITLPFDIKDMTIDAMNNVRTLPTKLGVRSTIYLCYILLLISGIFHWYLQEVILKTTNGNTMAIALSLIATGVAIKFTQRKNNDTAYFGLLDGMIILQFLLVLLFSF
ncbi:MAG: UbiA family prenyltransferase [Bacteroidetes bacterium]|nr:UbiA family prenyltransferase [Bacteroidota bacterium]